MRRANEGRGDGQNSALWVSVVGFASWFVPGLGHFLVAERVRGMILMITVTLTFWSGVAIGGVRDTVDSETRKAWFVAQTCAGVHALAAHVWSSNLRNVPPEEQLPPANWLSAETGVVYAGVAGLLNILIILDALIRAETVKRRDERVTKSVRRRGT